MPIKFPPRSPDHVAEQIATVLSTKRAMEFKEIFDLVYAALRSKELARVGEEIILLRTHDKLQTFVASGIATKNERKYKGVPKMLKEFFKTAAEHNARVASGQPFQPGVMPKVTAASTGVKTETPVKEAQGKIARVR